MTMLVGKNLQLNNTDVYRVTGIMKKMPANSSFTADFIIPFEYMKKSRWYSDQWANNSIGTYILLAKGSKTGFSK